MNIRADYPEIFKSALTFLIAFDTTYFSESDFSTLLFFFKQVQKKKLREERDLRFKLTSFNPDICNLIDKHQCRNLIDHKVTF